MFPNSEFTSLWDFVFLELAPQTFDKLCALFYSHEYSQAYGNFYNNNNNNNVLSTVYVHLQNKLWKSIQTEEKFLLLFDN